MVPYDHGPDGLTRPRHQGTTKSALRVFELQERLPNARFVYVSATGATEPQHLQIFRRLGLWGARTAFDDQFDFVRSISRGGCGAMELVAMHMKASGQYLGRVLSFKGATFEICKEDLADDFVQMYNHASEIWGRILEGQDQVRNRKRFLPILWGANQRFWMQMCMAAKVQDALPTPFVASVRCRSGRE